MKLDSRAGWAEYPELQEAGEFGPMTFYHYVTMKGGMVTISVIRLDIKQGKPNPRHEYVARASVKLKGRRVEGYGPTIERAVVTCIARLGNPEPTDLQ
ncbi:MAG: hypothetical protein HYY12_04060 [Candidatus Methylomirabilis oxyfera]|nr:hypothetical protein [Candidatus Methylomirabilis oxyfera]